MSALSQRESSGLEAAELSAQFARAAAAAGGVLERTYRIGGTNLRLRYAGPALLERLSPSIEHLRADTDGADEHEVEIWDGASTGTEAPPRPPESETLPLAGIVTGLVGGKRVIYQAGLRSLSVLDEEANRSWYWAADVNLLPEWDCATPLRHILHLHLSARGVQFTHAGAVGRAAGGFIICGRSGSGKSSSTLSTLGSELLYAGDDYVGVSLGADGSAPYVHSIYGCGKLESDHVHRFPDLRYNPQPERVGAVPADREKTIFYVRETYPQQVTSGFPLRGIVIPRVSANEATSLVEIPRTLALRALIPSTIFEIHGAGQETLSTLSRVAALVPAFELRLGADMDAVPSLLGEQLDRLG